MSVLAGVLQLEEPLYAPEKYTALLEAVKRFPGDDFGYWSDSSVLLAARSQWITPESTDECLPFRDESVGLVIAADAVIDNRRELFDALNVDSALRSHVTDAELILMAYRKWGREVPKHLIGDFAFVIWDARRRILFGARDLLGSRTLYYYLSGERFAFCSVIQPLFTLPGVDKKLGEERFAEFLAIPTLLDAVDLHTTFYKDIYQLPPAHSFTLQQGKLIVERYGSILSDHPVTFSTDGEYIEAFRDIFQEAIRTRLRTTGQVGVTLSGGLDSGSVAGFAAGMLAGEGRRLLSFSHIPVSDFVDWTPRNLVADETPNIQSIVNHVGNIEPHFLDFPNINPLTEIDDSIHVLEAPYKNFENSFWVRNIHKKAAQHGVGVLLTGARGNFSISWGSAVQYYAILLKRLRWVQLYREISLYGKHLRTDRKRIVRAVREQAFPVRQTEPFSPYIPSLIHPDFAKRTGVFEKLESFDVGLRESSSYALRERQDYFDNLAILNLQGSMAAKSSYRLRLWERDPTSDARVVRFCLSLPFEQYVQNGFGRSLIRRATEGLLPDEVRLNQRNRGVQGVDWAHRIAPQWPDFQGEIRQLCKDETAAQYLDVDQAKKSLELCGDSIRPEQAEDPNLTFLMRSMIAYRFIRKIS